MSSFSLPPDDRPPSQPLPWDGMLRRQLEESIGRRFFQACDQVSQALLARCDWYITTHAQALTLVIACPNQGLNWCVLNNIVVFSHHLQPFSDAARIRVCPPIGTGNPFEIRVDEISVYRDSL